MYIRVVVRSCLCSESGGDGGLPSDDTGLSFLAGLTVESEFRFVELEQKRARAHSAALVAALRACCSAAMPRAEQASGEVVLTKTASDTMTDQITSVSGIHRARSTSVRFRNTNHFGAFLHPSPLRYHHSWSRLNGYLWP